VLLSVGSEVHQNCALAKPSYVRSWLTNCRVWVYIYDMSIRSFRSKALDAFFRTGNARRLSVQNSQRVRRILLAIADADHPDDLNLPGYFFHVLTGDQKGRYSVRVTGNSRITFGWDQGAVEVDLEDDH